MMPKPWQSLPEPKTFGEHIHLARLKRQWQVKELGEKVGVDEASIIHWEKGHHSPPPSCIRRLKVIFPEIATLPFSTIYPDFPLEPQTVAEQVKHDRLCLDMNQIEYADRLGLCVDTIRDREGGRCLKPLPEKGRARALNVPPA